MNQKKSFWDGSSRAMRWFFVGFCGGMVAVVLGFSGDYLDSMLLAYASMGLMLVSLTTMFVAVLFLPKRLDSLSLRSDVRGWRDRWRERRSK